MREIRDRGAVVIGGGSGIGRGTALGLAAAGARVVVADIDADSAATVASELRGLGADAFSFTVDSTDRASLRELARLAADRLGAIHILSNNVGIQHDRRIDACSDADWAWAIEFNVMSIVRAVDEFLPALRSHGEGGHIVNTASMAALVAQGIRTVPAHLGLYTATKHAVLGYTEILRDELADEGLGVSVLCPGMVRSNLARTSARYRPDRYGGQLPDPGEMPQALREMAMPQEQLGPLVVRAILANRLHIFTHPERRAQVEERHRRLLDDFEFAADDRESA